MQELKIFDSEEFGEIRTIVIDGEPWFVGKDVASALEYNEPHKAVVKHVDEEDRTKRPILTDGGVQEMWILNESGVYSLIFGSRLETAKKFKRWVTAEVLPTLRKNGTYSVDTSHQYPVTAAAMDSATNAGRLFERIMKSEGIPPFQIAMVVRGLFQQVGVDVPDYVIKIPAYEQYTLDIVTR